MAKEHTIITRLEADMAAYDRIFLVCGKDALVHKIAALLCCTENVGNSRETRLVLLSQEIFTETGGIPNQPAYKAGSDKPQISERTIPAAEAKTLCQLYSMYEFSDRFHILSREPSFGGLLNFIDTGLLGEEEALKALLH